MLAPGAIGMRGRGLHSLHMLLLLSPAPLPLSLSLAESVWELHLQAQAKPTRSMKRQSSPSIPGALFARLILTIFGYTVMPNHAGCRSCKRRYDVKRMRKGKVQLTLEQMFRATEKPMDMQRTFGVLRADLRQMSKEQCRNKPSCARSS